MKVFGDNSQRLFVILLMFGAMFDVPAMCQSATRAPKVFCVVVGVSNVTNWPVPQAAPSAEAFASMLRQIFPGQDTEVRLLINEQATRKALEDIIDAELPALPRYSSIIFYFAGHGSRNENNPTYTEDLQLILSGASATDFRTNSIKLRYLIDALASTKMATGMVFLDACYSGSLDDYEFRHPGGMLTEFGERFILFSSSGSTETTYSGAFTQALLTQWKALSARGQCVRPTLLRAAIQAEINRNPLIGMGTQTVMKLPKYSSERCLNNLGVPSTFVVLAPTGIQNGQIQVQFDDEAPDSFSPAHEKLYMRLVPKTRTIVSVGFDGRSTKFDLTAADLVNDLVVLSISPDSSLKKLLWTGNLPLSDKQVNTLADKALFHVGTDAGTRQMFLYAANRATAMGNNVRAIALVNAANNVRSEQLLYISRPPQVATASATSSKSIFVHVVQNGETLSHIARKYQISLGNLAASNGITDPTQLKAGQHLVISK